MPDLLIELFSEEIPARMQLRAAEDLKKRLCDALVDAGLTYGGAAALSTPRRLTLAIEGLLVASPTLRQERKGPKVGAPDKAIEGFLRGAGATRDQLEERDTPKGRVWFVCVEKAGQPAAEIVATALEQVIRAFPWPKSMRWGAGSLRWVRPLQSILCILSDEAGCVPVPLKIDGIVAGDRTSGHRFMAPDSFSVTSFEDYAATLKSAFVLLDPAERADHIHAEATNMAFAAGLELVADAGLLAEVAGLVEWPVVLMGDIDAEFLDLPPEVLRTSMKEHQKFFSLRNPKTGRIERFITVANRETADHGATILAGNQKVLAARLADAKFFWENDLRVARSDMNKWSQSLENVTFHNKLGSQGDRIRRMAVLARELAPATGADPDKAALAAELAKLDLSSEMVYEFPELQGLMGRYYIAASGRDADIAAAAEEHYAPLGPSDDVPAAPISVAVALADKIDLLTGFWAIDEKPTGSRDPFALRRAALGVIRLVLENEVTITLLPIIAAHRFSFSDFTNLTARLNNATQSNEGVTETFRDYTELFQKYSGTETAQVLSRFFDKASPELARAMEAAKIPIDEWHDLENAAQSQRADLLTFFHDRLKVHLRDQGIRHDIIDACIAMPGNDDLNLLVKRAHALQQVIGTDEGENLLQGFKRTNNILTQAEAKDGVEYSYGADPKFAETDSERALFAALDTAEARIAPALEAQDFPAAMAAMAALRAPIDDFFQEVQINTDNATLRRNRLNLLSHIRRVCTSVADLTLIAG